MSILQKSSTKDMALLHKSPNNNTLLFKNALHITLLQKTMCRTLEYQNEGKHIERRRDVTYQKHVSFANDMALLQKTMCHTLEYQNEGKYIHILQNNTLVHPVVIRPLDQGARGPKSEISSMWKKQVSLAKEPCTRMAVLRM